MAAKMIALVVCFALIGCFVQQAQACDKFFALMARAGVRADVIDRLRAFEALRPIFAPIRNLRPLRPIAEGLRPLLNNFRPSF
ncbi:hypothetical protein HDE_12525 [Halotydeus destructor]|nr:hypothetical protein HDE_12525 [Halotydeus destructor]